MLRGRQQETGRRPSPHRRRHGLGGGQGADPPTPVKTWRLKSPADKLEDRRQPPHGTTDAAPVRPKAQNTANHQKRSQAQGEGDAGQTRRGAEALL